MLGKKRRNKWFSVGRRDFTSKEAQARFERIAEALGEVNEDALLADGFEMALIGIARRFGMEPVACYDRALCIGVLIDRDGMSHEDAEEHFEYNVIGSGVPHAPIFVSIADAEGWV